MRKKIIVILVAAMVLSVGSTSYAEEITPQDIQVEPADGEFPADEEQSAEKAKSADEVQPADESQPSDEVNVADEAQSSDEEQSADVTQMAASDITQDEALAWVKAQVGKSIDADGVYGAQCVDLILAYYDFLGVPRSMGNGADYVDNKLPAGWSRIKGAVPQAGDILVYTGGPNGYGHVGIFESKYSTYHQNVGQSYVQRVTWAYDDGFKTTPYWGVIRPNLSASVAPALPNYKDVSASDWFYNDVNYVYEKGLMTGLTPNTFGPYEPLMRAQFATILYRMEGSPKTIYRNQFSDVSDGQWYSNPVIWANDAKIVTGYGTSGLFGTSDNITREQMTVMMFRYAQYKGYDTSQRADFSRYKDASSVSGFAKDAMQWAVSKGIISGKENGTIIDPQGNALRAECAVIIKRFMESHQ